MGNIFAAQPQEENVIQEAEPGDLLTEVRYPDGIVDNEEIPLADNLTVGTVKTRLLNGKAITNSEDYILIAVWKNTEYILPDNDKILNYLHLLVTEGDDNYIVIRSR